MKVRLGDIATLITKGTTPTSVGFDFTQSGINFVKIESITETGQFIPRKFAHINEICNEKLSRSQLAENDILFSIAGAIGRVAIVKKDILPANTNQALAIIRVPEGTINYSFLVYALQSPTLLEQFEKQKQGVAQLNLSLKNVGDFVIPDCPIEEQTYIATVLDNISDLIAQHKVLLLKLDELVKSRFIELFGDPITNPMRWAKVPLSSCVESIENGKSFVCEATPRSGERPAILKLSAATYGYYRPEENKAMFDENQFIEPIAVRNGDLLFTRKNTPDLVGMCAYVYETPDRLMMPDLIFRINTMRQCNKIFLWKLINHDLFRECVKSLATGSAKSMSNISKERLFGLEIILPPVELQNKFAAFVEQVDKSKFELQQSLEKLDNLKKSLMQKYFK